MVQERASVSIQFATLSGNADAGLFGLGASVVELADVTVSDTLGAKLPGSEDTSGDGIVVSDDPANGPYQTDAFTGSADRVTIDGYERAGVLLSGSGLAFTTLSPFIISGHTGAVDDPGAGEPVVQSEATLVSDDAYVTLDVAVPFTPDPAPTDALEP